MASGDALTRELLPGGFTSGYGDLSQNPALRSVSQDPTLRATYLPFAVDEGPFYGPDELGPDMTNLISGLRQALFHHRDDEEMVRRIVHDIQLTTRTIFAVHRDIDKRYGIAPERGWLEFTADVEHFIASLNGGDPAQEFIRATMLINAVHDGDQNSTQGASILRRMTKDNYKANDYLAVLDASHGSYEDQLAYAGYLGGMLYGYLLGKRKSLTGLPGGRAVPAAFTHLG